jgi:hypothetical protein
MAYDFNAELKRVKDYYNGDPLQKRFSALITGESGSGKTFIASTCRFPVHIDSFDPGGTKCLRKWIESGDIIADTQWENEDPYKPRVFAEWMKAIDIRLRVGYFNHFGTYILDSATTWGDAIMNYQLGNAGVAGDSPRFTKDYTPQKTLMVNYIKKLMNIPCDFILTGHLKAQGENVGMSKDGSAVQKISYRFMTTGQALITIPLLFDELYVLSGRDAPGGTKRELLLDAQGKYVARSRLKGDGKLSAIEEPNIKNLLKKIGLNWEDKPKLNSEGGDNN